ncbi:MAG TPA: hypothetical protein VJ890_22810 [Vineibacter sp.]|nr:hypothetical protein [Vineibacter sp.]
MTFVLTACTIASLPYDRQTAAIKSIGVVTPARWDDTGTFLATSVGGSFGLIGALVDAAITSSRNARLRTILREQEYAPLGALQDEVIKALVANGYVATAIAQAAERREFLNASPASPSPLDAYLDMVVLAHGYQAVGIGPSAPWRPFVVLRVRLVRLNDSAVLMQNTIAYNPLNAGRDVITISADTDFQFSTFNDLMAEPRKATSGLKTAIEQTAKTIATLLR